MPMGYEENCEPPCAMHFLLRAGPGIRWTERLTWAASPDRPEREGYRLSRAIRIGLLFGYPLVRLDGRLPFIRWWIWCNFRAEVNGSVRSSPNVD